MNPLMKIGTFLVALFFLSCAKTASKDIYKDDFNRADGPVGTSYTTVAPSPSSFQITGGRAYPMFNVSQPAILFNPPLTTNYKASVTMQISGGTYTGSGYILARSTANNTPNNAFACGYNGGALVLLRVIGGSAVILGSITLAPLVSGTSDRVVLTVDKYTIRCEIKGGVNNSVILVVDSTYSDGGYVGLMGGAANNFLYFDDLLIENL